MRPFLVLLALALAAAPAAAQQDAMIHAYDEGGTGYRFVPPTLEVAPGATVIVMNVGQEAHKLVSVEGAFETPTLEPDPTVEHSFQAPMEPGEYRYYCPFHATKDATPESGMAGILNVKPASTPTPSPTGDVGTTDAPGPGALLAGVAFVAAALLVARRR